MSSGVEQVAAMGDLRILIVEDGGTDADAIERTLRKAKLTFIAQRASGREAFACALKKTHPDVVVLSDRFASQKSYGAIKLVHEESPGIPIIIIDEKLSEEGAVKLARAGADDYVARDGMARLAFAIERLFAQQGSGRLRRALDRDIVLNTAILEAEHETSHDGILVVDLGARIVSVNRRFVEMWGIPPELAGSRDDAPVRDAVTDRVADPQQFVARVNYLYEHPSEKADDEVLLKDGRSFQRYTSPMWQGDRYLGRVWFFHDISDYKRAEQKIREDASQFRALVEHDIAGIVIIRDDGRFAYVNPGLCALLGYDQEELIGHLAQDYVAEPSKKEIGDRIQEAVSGGRQSYRLSAALRRRDGAIVDCMLQGAAATYEGKPAVIGVALDISELKRAERSLEQANRVLQEDATQFRGLVEQEIAGVFILKRDGTIAYVNPRFLAMLGYSPEEAIGHRVTEFIADEDKAHVVPSIMEVMSGARTSSQVTASLRRKDGSYLPFLGQGTIATYQGEPAIMGVTVDISELKHMQETLQRSNRVLKTLSAANSALVHTPTEDELLNKMCRVIVDVGGYKLAWIGYQERDSAKSVRPVAWSEPHEAIVKSLNVTWSDTDWGRGPAGSAVRTGETVVNQNFGTNPSLAPWRDEALKHGFGSSIALPLKDGATTFGAITIFAAEPDAFNEDEVALLTELAGDLAYGIISQRARVAQEESVRRLRRSMQATVLAIASTLEQRDPYTAGHQRAVAQLAAAIARELKIPEDEIEGIYLAGVVHDIGKIHIPSEILAKPGKLTKLEYQLVQTHAQAGYDIMKGVEFPWPVANMILQHHERMDGSGYPNALKGDQILIGAKIIAVADVVQAMTARRPYRGAVGLDAALAEVEQNKGKKYYAPAVDACLDLFRNKGFKFDSDFGHESS